MEIDYMEINSLQAPPSLGRALNFAAGAATALSQQMLAPHDLSLAQWVILSALWKNDGLSVAHLAAYTGNNAPAISRILDRMEQKSLVQRRPSPADRRATHVFLCDGGEALRPLATFWQQVNSVLLDGFNDGERATLFALLARAEANARRSVSGSCPAD